METEKNFTKKTKIKRLSAALTGRRIVVCVCVCVCVRGMRQILSAAEGTAGLRCIDSTHAQCNVGAIDAAALGPFKK